MDYCQELLKNWFDNVGLFRGAWGQSRSVIYICHIYYATSKNSLLAINDYTSPPGNTCQVIKHLEFHSIRNMYKIPGEGAVGGVAVEADVPEDQQDLAGAPFLPAMLEQVQ